MSCSGLVVRCATTPERERILDEHHLGAGASGVVVIESGDSLDYVVSRAVSWQEDDESAKAPSALAFFAPATGQTRILPTDAEVPWPREADHRAGSLRAW